MRRHVVALAFAAALLSTLYAPGATYYYREQ